MGVKDLPFRRAVRDYKANITFSVPLPPWAPFGSFTELSGAALQAAKRYLRGEKPPKPYQIHVPESGGKPREWLIPSVSDQLALHACVTALAPKLQNAMVHKERVYSFQYIGDPRRVPLFWDMNDSWEAFAKETERRLKETKLLLRLDLKSCFQCIDRPRLYAFLEAARGDLTARKLVQHLLDAWAVDREGLPRVNDSLFLLGDAYLSQVDAKLARHSTNFIRYMDDYNVFGSSERELESIFEAFGRDLAPLGFKLSDRKAAIINEEAYEAAAEYLSPPIGTFVRPKMLLKHIKGVLESPNTLTKTLGRAILSSIRRLRRRRSPERDEFSSAIRANEWYSTRALELLDKFTTDRQTWRALWIVYLIADLLRNRRVREAVAAIRGKPNVAPVVRFWASKIAGSRGVSPESPYDLAYLAEGKSRYGP